MIIWIKEKQRKRKENKKGSTYGHIAIFANLGLCHDPL
jgi:hypothetical protein